jgi:hypothetical protein
MNSPAIPALSRRLIPAIALLWSAAPHAADEAPDGQALHDARCLSCHGTEVYTRENRKINSLSALSGQVSRCTQATGVKWFDDEHEAVVDYLNRRFYKFGGQS